ncbi:MAG: amino acid-binding protein [Propionibacteriaceae bacterium]|jgi:hypothetical protein|nr:amino acid-binding protein [Propionibacteriaceae bacterium]
MFLLRVQLPDTPGTLGRLAVAIGDIGGNILSLEIVDHTGDSAIDDFMVELPAGALPDSLVSACQAIPGVRVLWVSRHHNSWRVESDVALLGRMSDSPGQGDRILTEEAPNAFNSTWAALLDHSGQPVKVAHATDLAPDFAQDGVGALGDLTTVRTFELPAEWLPQWGETIVALAPLTNHRVIVIGRQGGPAYLNYELTRLKHLAALAD